MSKVEISIYCCLCSTAHKTEIDLPDGWDHRYGGIDDESSGFCPKHAKIAAFTRNQCVGCVSGWGDCPLWDGFAYSGRRSLTESDFTALKAGVCPKRTNGTLSMSGGKMKETNLSETNREGGMALADAIKEYWIAYP